MENIINIKNTIQDKLRSIRLFKVKGHKKGDYLYYDVIASRYGQYRDYGQYIMVIYNKYIKDTNITFKDCHDILKDYVSESTEELYGIATRLGINTYLIPYEDGFKFNEGCTDIIEARDERLGKYGRRI
jgi:hypothetical protein